MFINKKSHNIKNIQRPNILNITPKVEVEKMLEDIELNVEEINPIDEEIKTPKKTKKKNNAE